MSEENKNENTDVGGEYSSKSGYSKAELTSIQSKKCQELGSMEMRHGYYNYDKMGNRIYIPDTRKTFIEAVRTLRNMLAPEIEKDEDQEYKKIEKQLSQQEQDAINIHGVHPVSVNGLAIITHTEQPKYIPYVDELFPVALLNKYGHTVGVEKMPGIFNRNHHDYWNYLVDIYRTMLEELNKLMDRFNYFDEGTNY